MPKRSHHPQRRLVARHRDRDHLAQVQVRESEVQRGLGRLGGVAAAPRGTHQAPADLDGRHERRVVMRHVQADETRKGRFAGQFERPHAPAALGDRVTAARGFGTGLFGREHARKIATHLGVGIHRGPWREVGGLPLAQHAASRMQFPRRRERGQHQRRRGLTGHWESRPRAPRPATAARRHTRCGARARAAARSSGSWRGRAACRGGGSAPTAAACAAAMISIARSTSATRRREGVDDRSDLRRVDAPHARVAELRGRPCAAASISARGCLNSVTTQCDGVLPWAWQAAAISSLARTTSGCSNWPLTPIADGRDRAAVRRDEVHQAERQRLDARVRGDARPPRAARRAFRPARAAGSQLPPMRSRSPRRRAARRPGRAAWAASGRPARVRGLQHELAAHRVEASGGRPGARARRRGRSGWRRWPATPRSAAHARPRRRPGRRLRRRA